MSPKGEDCFKAWKLSSVYAGILQDQRKTVSLRNCNPKDSFGLGPLQIPLCLEMGSGKEMPPEGRDGAVPSLL